MAAPTLSFSINKTPGCGGYRLTELTGTYDPNNTTGWGAPNYELDTATAATITIEKRNDDGTYTTSPLSPIDVFATLPSDEEGDATVTAEDAGYGVGSTFEDGIYRLTYTVTGDSGGAYELTKVMYYANTCAIDCCYQQKSKDAISCNYCCDGPNKELANIAYYYRLLRAAKCGSDLSLIQNYIDILTELCESCSGCSSGCSGC